MLHVDRSPVAFVCVCRCTCVDVCVLCCVFGCCVVPFEGKELDKNTSTEQQSNRDMSHAATWTNMDRHGQTYMDKARTKETLQYAHVQRLLKLAACRTHSHIKHEMCYTTYWNGHIWICLYVYMDIYTHTHVCGVRTNLICVFNLFSDY